MTILPAFVRLFAPFQRDLTLPLVAIVAAMMAVTVMIWGVGL